MKNFITVLCAILSPALLSAAENTKSGDTPTGNLWCGYALSEAGEKLKPSRALIATALYPTRYHHPLQGSKAGWRAATIASFDDANGRGFYSTMHVRDGLEPVGKSWATDAQLEQIHFDDSDDQPTTALAVAPFPLKGASGMPMADSFAFARVVAGRVVLHVPSNAWITYPLLKEAAKGERPNIQKFDYYAFDLPNLPSAARSVSLTACTSSRKGASDECLRVWVSTDEGIFTGDLPLTRDQFIESWRDFVQWKPVLQAQVAFFKAIDPDRFVWVSPDGTFRLIQRDSAKNTQVTLGTLDGYVIGFDAAASEEQVDVVALAHLSGDPAGVSSVLEWTSRNPHFVRSSLKLEEGQKPISVAVALAPIGQESDWEDWRESTGLTAGLLATKEDLTGLPFIRRLLITVRQGNEYFLAGAMKEKDALIWKSPRWYYIDRKKHPENELNLIKARFDTERLRERLGSLADFTHRLYVRYRELGFGQRYHDDPENYRGAYDAMIAAWYAKLSYIRDVRFIPSGVRAPLREEGFKGLAPELLVYQLLLWEDEEDIGRRGGLRLSQLSEENWEKRYQKRLDRTTGPVWMDTRQAVLKIEADLRAHVDQLGLEVVDDFDYKKLSPQGQTLFVIGRQYLQRPVAPLMRAFVAFARSEFAEEFSGADRDPFTGVAFWKSLHAFLKAQDPLYDVYTTDDLLEFFGFEAEGSN